MTDHPRFQPPQDSFETAYRAHHGGNLVAWVLRLTGPRRSAARAAWAGICAMLLLAAIVQVLGTWRSASAPSDNQITASGPTGAR